VVYRAIFGNKNSFLLLLHKSVLLRKSIKKRGDTINEKDKKMWRGAFSVDNVAFFCTYHIRRQF